MGPGVRGEGGKGLERCLSRKEVVATAFNIAITIAITVRKGKEREGKGREGKGLTKCTGVI